MYQIRHMVIAMTVLSALSCEGGKGNPGENETLSGGETTVFVENSTAFSTPAANLITEDLELHFDGDRAFEAVFVSAPAVVNSGLGPLFNNSSCVGCHTRDGRGAQSLLLRLSIAGTDEHGGPLQVPNFGEQLQTRSTVQTNAEGQIGITYTEVSGSFDDGTPYSLRKPNYNITGAYTTPSGGVMTSPRFAPPVFGLGLLEAISENEILANTDPVDLDGNGISGRANYVWDKATATTVIGRFGWKANQPNLRQQTAGAYNGDMGITTSLFSQENCSGQTQCDTLSDDPELTDEILEAATFYVQTLGVPARRKINDPDVVAGKRIFKEAGCISCHVPSFVTGESEIKSVSQQYIFPYTDMLLHDMGDGLADGRSDFLASGSEWRTPPLWGIGLSEVVNGHTNFLHDGRARNLTEAILWHGGEAGSAQSYFKKLSLNKRTQLLKFLNSL